MPISHTPCRRRYIGPLPSCSTFWGGNLFRRFCKMFFLRVPQAFGLYCSCHAAKASKGELSENILQNPGNKLPPQTVGCMNTAAAMATSARFTQLGCRLSYLKPHLCSCRWTWNQLLLHTDMNFWSRCFLSWSAYRAPMNIKYLAFVNKL